MLCDYLLREQYVFRYGSLIQAQYGKGAHGDDILKAALLALEGQTLKTVSRLLPKSEGLS